MKPNKYFHNILLISLVSSFLLLFNFSEAAVCSACLRAYQLNAADVNSDVVPGISIKCAYCDQEFIEAKPFSSLPSSTAHDSTSDTDSYDSDDDLSGPTTAPPAYSSLSYSDYISTAIHSEHLSTLTLPDSCEAAGSGVYVSLGELAKLQQDIMRLCDRHSGMKAQTFSIQTCSPRFASQNGFVGAHAPTNPATVDTAAQQAREASREYLANMAVCRQVLQRIVSGRVQDAASEDIDTVNSTFGESGADYLHSTAQASEVDKEEKQCQTMYSKLIESYAFFVITQTGVRAFRDCWREAGLISGLKLKDTCPGFRLYFPNCVELAKRSHTGLLPDILLEDTCRLLVDSKYSEYPELFSNLQGLCSILNRQASKRSGVPEPEETKITTANTSAHDMLEKITDTGKDLVEMKIGIGYLAEFVIVEEVYSIYLYFSDDLGSLSAAYVIDHILSPCRFEYKEDAVKYIIQLLKNIGLDCFTLRTAALPPSL